MNLLKQFIEEKQRELEEATAESDDFDSGSEELNDELEDDMYDVDLTGEDSEGEGGLAEVEQQVIEVINLINNGIC